MTTQHFTLNLLTTQTPQHVFDAVNNVRGWWTGYYSEEITGPTGQLHDEFTFRAANGAHVSTHRLVEVIPDKKIVWLTTYSNFSFTKKSDEWTGTKVIFEITKKGNSTQLTFTHEGLHPKIECYVACAPAWTQYLQNKLLPLMNDTK